MAGSEEVVTAGVCGSVEADAATCLRVMGARLVVLPTGNGGNDLIMCQKVYSDRRRRYETGGCNQGTKYVLKTCNSERRANG